ncbi:MAG TPA: hypothetical protein VLD13_12505 [Gaiellaceae bacterium]|nr:hypothetical protein [Gaiellaceae bacterium]
MSRRAVAIAAAVAAAFGAGISFAASQHEPGGAPILGPAYGISIDLPRGWVGRISDANAGNGAPLADLQAGSFDAADCPDLVKDDDVGTNTAKAMAAGDVLVLVWETSSSHPAYEPLQGPLHVTAADLGSSLEGFPTGHAVAHVPFSTQGRAFDLFVEFGTASPAAAQVERVDAVLGSLRVAP